MEKKYYIEAIKDIDNQKLSRYYHEVLLFYKKYGQLIRNVTQMKVKKVNGDALALFELLYTCWIKIIKK